MHVISHHHRQLSSIACMQQVTTVDSYLILRACSKLLPTILTQLPWSWSSYYFYLEAIGCLLNFSKNFSLLNVTVPATESTLGIL